MCVCVYIYIYSCLCVKLKLYNPHSFMIYFSLWELWNLLVFCFVSQTIVNEDDSSPLA